MSDRRFSEISDRIRESCPNACVLYIDEVINESLLDSFNQLRQSRPFEIKQLFHGTSNDCIHSIASTGFNPKKIKHLLMGTEHILRRMLAIPLTTCVQNKRMI